MSALGNGTFEFQGRLFNKNLDKLKIFSYYTNGSGANVSGLFEMSDPTNGYVVPEGKKLVIVGITKGDPNSNLELNGIGYSDNDPGVTGDPDNLVNPVPTISDFENGGYWMSFWTAVPGESPKLPGELLCDLTVPEGKYPYVVGFATGSDVGQVFAFELAA